jgi:hypothetical protein
MDMISSNNLAHAHLMYFDFKHACAIDMLLCIDLFTFCVD